jgi:polysaccharide export outer membrane protein
LNDGAKAELTPLDSRVGAMPSLERPERSVDLVSDKKLLAKKAAEVQAQTKTGPGYRIGPQDVLEISVFKVPELSKGVQVAEVGTVNLPLVGDIVASGRTAQEIERDLATRLGEKYLKNPQVTVFVKEYNSQRVTVDGAVKKPGMYPLRGNTTLTQVLAMAEGIQSEVSSNVIVVVRQGASAKTAARFDIEEIRAGKTQDVPLQAGDLIMVETSGTKQAFNNFVKVLPMMNIFVPLL